MSEKDYGWTIYQVENRRGGMAPDFQILKLEERPEIIVLTEEAVGVYESLKAFDEDGAAPVASFTYGQPSVYEEMEALRQALLESQAELKKMKDWANHCEKLRKVAENWEKQRNKELKDAQTKIERLEKIIHAKCRDYDGFCIYCYVPDTAPHSPACPAKPNYTHIPAPPEDTQCQT